MLRLQLADLPPGPLAQRMDEELAGLAHLIGQLLRFAQLEEAMAAERRAIDLVAISRQTCEELAPAALASGHELAFVVPEHAVVISGNTALLATALRNLVENALRAAPADTVVTTTVAGQRLIVDDQGPGVPDAFKVQVFERLWQADRRREGAGIGLALVRRVAQLHGGAVRVEDRPGGGSRFILDLAQAADPPAGAVAPATPISATYAKRIASSGAPHAA